MADEDEDHAVIVTIPMDGTFADLFRAIEVLEEKYGTDCVHLDEELWDNFDTVVVNMVFAFRENEANKADATKVLDFFSELGYTKSFVTAYLPIKFKKTRK